MSKLVGLLLILSASSAWAQATYIFSGTGDGVVNGVAFAGANYVFTVTGDVGAVQTGTGSPPPVSNVLTGGSIRISGTACANGCSIANPSSYIVYDVNAGILGISTVGHAQTNGQTLVEGCWGCGTNVDGTLRVPVAPTASTAQGALAPYLSFATSAGNVQITKLDGPITYSVTLPIVMAPTFSASGLAALLLAVVAIAGCWLRARRPV